MHLYEVRSRKDRGGFDLLSDALPFGRLWYQQVEAAIGYAKFYSRSQPGEVRVFDAGGAVVNVQTWTARRNSGYAGTFTQTPWKASGACLNAL